MKTLYLILIVLLIAVTQCHAQDKVIVAASDSWPPFVDPSHPNDGLSLEIIRAAYATQGYEVKMQYVPWARAMDGVKKGKKYDIIPNTWMTEERKEYLAFSDEYASNEIKFIKRKDDPFEFNGMESLKGKKIGTVRGYGYDNQFMTAPHFIREEANDLITNIKKLTHSSKRVDLTLEDEIVARVSIGNKNPELLYKIEFTKNAITTNGLYVTSGFQNPRHKELINAFNTGLEIIKSNGEYEKILEKYGI